MNEKLRKVWNFIWHDDSIWSWLANLLIAFIAIKFIIYPIIGLLLGTSLPVVAVVSSSMDQGVINNELCGEFVDPSANFWETCGQWYEERGITEEEFSEFTLSKGFSKGDVILLRGVKPADVKVGDIIIFSARKSYPIIHRVVDVSDTIQTKGDHNAYQIEEYALSDGRYLYECVQQTEAGAQVPSLCGPGTQRVTSGTPNAIKILDETQIQGNEVIGRAVARIPLLGWIKILFVDALSALTGK